MSGQFRTLAVFSVKDLTVIENFTFEYFSSVSLHCPNLCLFIPHTSQNLSVEPDAGKNPKLGCHSIEVAQDFCLPWIRLAPVEILRGVKVRKAFRSKAYEAEAEAVEMCKDVALTSRIAVLEPGAPQHTFLLQDSESSSWNRESVSKG